MDTYIWNIAHRSITWNLTETTQNTDARTWNTSNGFVAKAPTEMTRIMQNSTQKSTIGTQKLDTTTQTMAQPTEFVNISFIAKEIWLEFDFVTCRGMIQEKGLVDSGANENCIDIKMAQKLGIKPRLLPNPMGLRNVDRTDNCRGWIKYWLPVAMFHSDKARMIKFLICDLG